MLNERIRALRKEHGYSQQQIAMKMHLSQGAVSQWENGLTVPAADQLIGLAKIFGISVDELLEVEKNNENTEDEADRIREHLRRDPSFRILFSAAENVKPEHLEAAARMLQALGKNDD